MREYEQFFDCSTMFAKQNKLAKKDVKGGRQADYTENYKNTLSITSKINAFKKFVDTNLSSEEIIDYYFDSVIEDKYTSLIFPERLDRASLRCSLFKTPKLA